MPPPLECLRYHTPMLDGFVPDHWDRGYRLPFWHPGEPEKSFWVGLKMNRELCIPIRTARCPNCGYLEFYATKQP